MVGLILLLALVSASDKLYYPGMQGYFDQSCFQTLLQEYIPHKLNSIADHPPKEISITTSFLGTKMHFTFFNIEFHNFTLTPSQVSTSFETKNSKIITTLKSTSLWVSGNFTLKWFGNYEGYVSVQLLDSNITMPLAIDTSLNKIVLLLYPFTITPTYFNYVFKSNNRFLTSLKWLEYIWPVEWVMKEFVLRSFTRAVIKLNPSISYFFNELTYYQEFGTKDLALDYRVISLGVHNNSYVQAGVSGQVLVPSLKYASSPYALNETIPWTSTGPFRLQITDYFFNTFLWGLSTAGYLNNTYKTLMFNNVTFPLTTLSLRMVIPQLYETFGANGNISFTLVTKEFPMANTINGGLQVSATEICTVLVTTSEGVYEAFTFSFDMTTKILGVLENLNTGVFLNYKIGINETVLSNYYMYPGGTVQNIDISTIASAVQWGLTSFFEYYLPLFGQYSIKLPLPETMSIQDPKISVYNRAIEITGVPSFKY
ncbi:hypothetical protein SteCoe_9829 [Stentor coeruleus]|uniref:Lipid-binding serum glycoprotein C-terminal domain-containing protein n=1 Tax=Stentor coeruleus TaxID=5963 RepID=A0A1R2CH11_9CILI|nr:hypothetical protein SteCoe_9829 [Stentor coeruleus]